ncbi:MAG: HAMP domain-containing histidine kinase [Elusimicrobia bacterium]|nr:HAMP domain-containing histidine kinase [Elusimicrobiota bacterium]
MGHATESPAALRAVRGQLGQLRNVRRAESRMMGEVSHELRNQLALLVCAVEQLAAAPPDPGSRARLVELAQRNLRSMARLVSDLLDLSRLGSGRLQYRLERTAPGPIVARAADSFRLLASRRGITLSVDLERGSPEVFVDRELFERALDNMLENAVRFAARSVHVSVEDDGSEPGFAVFSVEDDGPGVPEGILNLAFDGGRPDSWLPIDAGHAGLGLAICRDIAERLDGRFWHERRRGGGARFRLAVRRYLEAQERRGNAS